MLVDRLIAGFDNALRTLVSTPPAGRPSPAEAPGSADRTLSEEERRHAAGLMRVNHSGEICAQALYQGQALVARDERLRGKLLQAASEECDHLAWTEERITELGSRRSLFNPLWYAGSFGIGAAAALLGDKWSLGFLMETERQVEQHLNSHLGQLPAADQRSRQIVEQMRVDEASHADMAAREGAAELPPPVRLAMRMTAKVMTTLAYRW